MRRKNAGPAWLCLCLSLAVGLPVAGEGEHTPKPAPEPKPAPQPEPEPEPEPEPDYEMTAVNGGVFSGKLTDGDASGLRFLVNDKVRTVNPKNMVSVRLSLAPERARPMPFNLYLANGDRLNGSVAGTGDDVTLAGMATTRVRVPLALVRAVRFGRLLGALQAKYDQAFLRELARGRDVVIVQRDTKPYPQPGRVISVGQKTITVRIQEQERRIEVAKVFGFVRAAEPPDAVKGLKVRVHLADAGRITLGLKRIGPNLIEGEEGTVERALATRLEFLGEHIAHLSDFDPIRVDQTTLFGKPPSWKKDRMVLDGPLRMSGKTYARGLGVHAHTKIEYVLGGRWKALFLRCGIDDAAGDEGAAEFRVLADGKVVMKFTRRRGEAPLAVELDMKGVDRLVLEARPGDSYISDFCDWAEARVYR